MPGRSIARASIQRPLNMLSAPENVEPLKQLSARRVLVYIAARAKAQKSLHQLSVGASAEQKDLTAEGTK